MKLYGIIMLSLLCFSCALRPIENNSMTHSIHRSSDVITAESNVHRDNFRREYNVKQRHYKKLFTLEHKAQKITFSIEDSILPYVDSTYIQRAISYIQQARVFSENLKFNIDFHFTTAQHYSEVTKTSLSNPVINFYHPVPLNTLTTDKFSSILTQGYNLAIHELTHLLIEQSGYPINSTLDHEYLAYKVSICSRVMGEKVKKLTFTNRFPNISREELSTSINESIKNKNIGHSAGGGRLFMYDFAKAVNNDHGISNKTQYLAAQAWCSKLNKIPMLNEYSPYAPKKYNRLINFLDEG